MVRTRRTSWLPEVGFCRNGSPGISSMATLTNARIGRPWPLNRVYLALTEVTNAGKLEIWPQCSTTIGGDGFFDPRSPPSGRSSWNSCSTAWTTEPSWVLVASKNISRVSLHGSAPLNSGGPAFFDPLVVLRSHLAVLAIVTSLVELEGDRTALVAGLAAAAGRGS